MIRKGVIAATLVAVLGLGTMAVAAGETFGGLPVVRVVVNGQALSVPGVVVEGRSMAPVRAIAESLGGTVAWDQTTFTATITAPDVSQLQAELARVNAENAELKAKLQPPTPVAGSASSTRTTPAAIGVTQTVTVKSLGDEYTAKITLLEAIRGDAAWQMVKARNMFNSAPKAGFEYIAVRIKFELVSIPDGKAHDVSPVHFNAVSATGKEYDPISVVAPDPALRTSLYAGSSHEGWTVLQVAVDDKAPVMAYGRKYDGTGGIWFSLK